MAIKFIIKKPIIPSGIDHNFLINKGVKTHEQLDLIAQEVQDARNGNSSLLNEILNVMNSVIKDHTKLQNIGSNTHAEIDSAIQEIIDARGTADSLKNVISALVQAINGVAGEIITDHTKLQNIGSNSHNTIDSMIQEIIDARNGHSTLSDELEALTPALKLSELTDVDIKTIPIKDGQTVIWKTSLGKFVAGDSGGAGSANDSVVPISQDAQTIITVPFQYILGNKMKVYRNGVLQDMGYDYTEINTNTITYLGTSKISDRFRFIL